MKVKNNTINMFLITVITLVSLFSYEINLYESYRVIQLLLSSLTIVTLIIIIAFSKSIREEFVNVIKKNKLLNLLCAGMLISNSIAAVVNYQMELVSIMSVILFVVNIYFFFLLVSICFNKEKENFSKYTDILTFIITILGIIAIIIGITGNFASYYKIELRSASIYFDPNFIALILATSICLNINKKKFKYILSNAINIIAIYFTGSRGAVISLVIALIVVFLIAYKTSFIKKIFIMTILILVASMSVNYLYTTGYFRVYQGTNGRIELYTYAFKLISENPVWGIGYSNIGDVLITAGFKNTSTHNSIIDMAVSFGLPTTLLYIGLLAKSVIGAIRTRKDIGIICAAIFMIINMNTILYTFGGVGIGSLLLTIILGMCNYRCEVKENVQN